MASSSGWFPSDEFEYIKSSSSSSSSSSEEEKELLSLRMEKETQEMINFIPGIILAYEEQPHHRQYIYRDREESHKLLWKDYFSENCTFPFSYFRRRFRMRRELFLHIQNDLENHNRYFIRKRDARGRLGLSSIQKITTALRILAYGASADFCDEYLKIGEATGNETLKEFCSSIIELYGEQYLRSPNEHDIQRLLQEGESRGFPGMLGSLDCMHWQWKNCPTAWHGTHRGHHHKPTLILEAVASHDTWIWHSFFGMSDGNNDINVLDHSPLFDNMIHGRMPPIHYTVNGRSYTTGYYLTDGIYPNYATLIQTIAHPTTAKEKLFAAKQESVRKDVERAFGVLQIRWGITQGPVRYWSKEDICNIMKTCIILHNMIIEDEREIDIEPWMPLPEENFRPPHYERDPSLLAAHISARLSRTRNRRTNESLRSYLLNHLWNIYGEEDV